MRRRCQCDVNAEAMSMRRRCQCGGDSALQVGGRWGCSSRNPGKVSVLWHVRHALSGCSKVLWGMRPKEMNPGASFLNLGRRVRRGITAHVFESPKDLGDFPSMAW